jgi:5'(3')-deoxyribonucleotidase
LLIALKTIIKFSRTLLKLRGFSKLDLDEFNNFEMYLTADGLIKNKKIKKKGTWLLQFYNFISKGLVEGASAAGFGLDPRI